MITLSHDTRQQKERIKMTQFISDTDGMLFINIDDIARLVIKERKTKRTHSYEVRAILKTLSTSDGEVIFVSSLIMDIEKRKAIDKCDDFNSTIIDSDKEKAIKQCREYIYGILKKKQIDITGMLKSQNSFEELQEMVTNTMKSLTCICE